MRLTRISLLAIMSILVSSGCSASRGGPSRLDSGDDRASIPPRHEHDYSPDPYESGDHYPGESPDSPTEEYRPPREPVPAPPALGVSRVKSVGWLRSLGAGHHSDTDRCGSACSDHDEPRIGQCSPIDPCVPNEGCGSTTRVQKFRNHVFESGKLGSLSPIRSFSKSVTKLFHKDPASSCADQCGTPVDQPVCSSPSVIHSTAPRAAAEPCGERPAPKRRCTPWYDESCGSCGAGERAYELHIRKKPGCLADPLDEPVGDEFDPGLITPDEMAPGHDGAVPGVPVLDAPAPGSAIHPVPGVPAVPVPPDPSAKLVEPPAWPRLRGDVSMKHVSTSQESGPSTELADKSATEMPKIQPRANR